MSVELIPQELRARSQWVYAGVGKIPMNPRTGGRADVTDPRSWGTFEEARRSGCPVGYVISKDDPYTFIDLDAPEDQIQKDRHNKIIQAFDSYTEYSISGKGLHIIVKGAIPKGVRKDKVEVYSQDRYMICTGAIFKNRPIEDYNGMLNVLYSEMSRDSVNNNGLQELEPDMDDDAVVEMASGAVNGEKFLKLCKGDWHGDYPSQSEADLALLSIIAFYTKSNEQVRRLFRYSALGQRPKAQRDAYLDYALKRIRSKEPQPLSFDQLLVPKGDYRGEAPPPPPENPMTFPEGLLGEIAAYIYSSSIRPVKEIALSAAISLMAGLCGRSYNISSMGLNQYIIVLAKTGCGKEGGAKGIDMLMSAARQRVPIANDFIGPGAFASGQALIRTLDKRPCFVSVMGEFGLTLQQICDPKAASPLTMLKRVLLDLYAKSGYDSILHSSVYSDAEKNTKMVRSPNVTIMGESTPETFFSKLTPMHIAEGLVPRFLVVEYKGKRPRRNENAFHPPEEELVQQLCNLLTIAATTQQNNTCCPVPMTQEAQEVFNVYDRFCDDQINDAENDVEMQLWNRAHLKALKLAALCAVGRNMHNPVVDQSEANWAMNIVSHDVKSIGKRFRDQEVGDGEQTFESYVRKVVDDYFTIDSKKLIKTYQVPHYLIGTGVVPFQYLRRRMRRNIAFQNDRRGVANAIRIALADMEDAGILCKVPRSQANELGARTDVTLWVKGENW